jgi:hypothetical protein
VAVTLDTLDVQTARSAVGVWRSIFLASRVPVPPAVDRLSANLTAMTFKRQEDVVPQQQWLTTAQVADRMHCSTSTALRTARRLGHRVGRIWLTPADALPEDD